MWWWWREKEMWWWWRKKECGAGGIQFHYSRSCVEKLSVGSNILKL